MIILHAHTQCLNWQNKYPPTSNHTFNSVTFINANIGLAVGEYGTIVITNDAGNNWSIIPVSISTNLNCIKFINDTIGFIVGDDGLILRTINGGYNWSQINSGTNGNLKSIFFPNSNSGYICGSIGILKSSDSGVNWQLQSNVPLNFYDPTLNSIFFTSPTIGYAVGNNGAIIKTIDGINWVELNSGITHSLKSIYFLDNNVGYITGGHPYGQGCILKTPDAGNTWLLKHESTPSLNNIYFTSATTGYAIGNYGRILKSTDYGNTWLSINLNSTEDIISSCFIDANTSYFVGTSGHIWKTTNSFLTSELLSTDVSNTLNSVYFTNSNNGYVIGSGIYETNNGGNSWWKISNKSGKSLTITSNNVAFFVKDNKIFKSTDLCVTWDSITFNTSYNFNTVQFIDDNNGYAGGSIVGGGGHILFKTNDGGANWQQISIVLQYLNIAGSINKLYFINSNIGYISGVFSFNIGDSITFMKPLLKTTDGGQSWQYSTIGSLPSMNIAGNLLFFHDENNGYITDSQGLLYRTNNGGIDWIPISSVSGGINSISFANQNIGYIVGDEGKSYKTYNAGINWELLTTPTYQHLNDVFFADSISGIAIGNGGTIMKYYDLLPSAAGTISGNTIVCQGQNSLTYTVSPINNATSYVWTLPSGATGTSTTNSISVDFGVNAISSEITVKGINDCGNGAISSKTITVNALPVAAGTITGDAIVCQGQTVNYNVPTVANATSYVWTLPSGATGTSTTNAITVDFGTSATTGDITVKGANSCGDGTASTLPITVNIKPTTPIITLNGLVLQSDALVGNQWFNQNGLINGATNQNHTVTVDGDYYVIVSLSGCSSDPSNTINVTVTGIEVFELGRVFKVYPNPVLNELIIEIEGNNETVNFDILNAIGQVVFKGNLVDKTTVQTSDFSHGVYLIKLENGKTFEFKKIIKE